MTLKEIQDKFLMFNLFKKDKRKEWLLTQKLSLLIYSSLIISGFTVYFITYNSINNQKIKMKKS